MSNEAAQPDTRPTSSEPVPVSSPASPVAGTAAPSITPASASTETPRAVAWQPFTPRGLAAFAETSAKRVAIALAVVAALAAGVIVWFIHTAWFPVVREAVRQLPEEGVIQRGELTTPHRSLEPLAQNRHLAFLVDVERDANLTLDADVRVEFHKSAWHLCSLPGCRAFPYPPDRTLPFNRPELEPWWGAWRPMSLWIAGLGSTLALWLIWLLLATLYAPALWVLAYFKDRQLKIAEGWRLGAMALVLPALLLTGAIALYGAGLIDLIRFLIAYALHFPLGWAWAWAGVAARPRVAEAPPRVANPFAS